MEHSVIAAEEWHERARALKDEGWQLRALCGLDKLHLGEAVRFSVVVQFLHTERKERQTIHIQASGEPPTVPSVVDLWSGASFPEREAYDMYGIRFEGHPKLERILLPEEWEGHPLRKDYGVGKIAVEFVPQPFFQVDAPGQDPAAGDAGVRVDRLGQTERQQAE